MRGIERLHPEARALAERLVGLCVGRGLPVLVTETLRTAAEQDALYAQGRTKPGAVVTNAKGSGYQSPHQWGVAFDFCKNVKGQEYSDAGFFRQVGAIGKSIGLCWGGDFKSFVDMPHFELDKYLPNHSTAALKAKYGSPGNFITSWGESNEGDAKMASYTIEDLGLRQSGAQWLAGLGAKPSRAVNGSLFTRNAAVGTVFIGGELVAGAGNGDGFGVDKDGAARFGRAYGAVQWRDFLSGYPALVVGGAAADLAGFHDQDIVGLVSPRSVVFGINGNVFMDCFPACTLWQLQRALLAMGAHDAVNLDGGGSCFLAAGGQVSAAWNSGRYLANVVCEWGGAVRPTLRRGSKGPDAAFLQQRLNAVGGYGLAEDGDFGAKSEAAVLALQKSKGLSADGVVGYKTWSVLEPPAESPAQPPAPASPEEATVGAAVAAGVVSDRAYWLGVLRGEAAASAANVKALMDNAVRLIGGGAV